MGRKWFQGRYREAPDKAGPDSDHVRVPKAMAGVEGFNAGSDGFR